MPGGCFEASLITKQLAAPLALFGTGAVAIHQALHLGLPAELVVACTPAALYGTVRAAVMRLSLGWTLLLLVFPAAASELLQCMQKLAWGASLVGSRDWGDYWAFLASQLALAMLLAMLIQLLVLLHRHRDCFWHLGAYTACTMCVLLLWFVVNTSGDNTTVYRLTGTVLMTVAALALWHATRRPPAEFGEAIADKPAHAAQALK